MDLVIENARVRGKDDLVSIGIADGMIGWIEHGEPLETATAHVDAYGGLVTPSYVNAHVHLDQVNTWPSYPNESGTFEEALVSNRTAKEAYTLDNVRRRIEPALEEAVVRGNTTIRGFVDVDDYAGLTGIEALVEARDRYSGLVDVQTCAFPQEGLGPRTHPSGEGILRDAMELGADVVGGIPWIEPGDREVEAHVDTVFDVATEYDRDVHFLVDDTDTPTSRALEYVAHKTLREDYNGRVTCSHARALAAYDDYHAERVIDTVAEADISILSNMHVVLFLGAHLDRQPIRRGITRVRELLEAGVNLAIAQDDAFDMWYPFGTNDLLELGWFACHAAKFSSVEEIETAYDMITTNAAEAMGIGDHGVSPGNPANLVVLDAETALDAFRTCCDRRAVIKDGRVVARSETTSTIERP